MTTTAVHATQPKLVARPERAGGHLRSMIETGRPCAGIARKLQAVEKTVTNARRVPIHDRVGHRLDLEGVATDRAGLEEIARCL